MSNAVVLRAAGAAHRSGPPVRPAGRPNYVLRRTVALFLAVAVAVLLAVAMSGLLAGLGGGPASASGALPAPVARYHVVQPGESLWTIGMEHHGEVDLTHYVDTLISLNGGTVVQVGQAVWLP